MRVSLSKSPSPLFFIFLQLLLITFCTGLNLPFEAVSKGLFPLPTLGSKLKTLAKTLVDGVGFLLIRGLDPKQLSNEANIVMYLGVSSYLGEKRGIQDELGNMLRKCFPELRSARAVPLLGSGIDTLLQFT